MNFKAVLALPKTAGSALTHKSISFIELFGALYMYISGPSPKFAVLPTGHKSRPNHIFCFYKNASSRDFYIMTLLLTNKFNQGSTNLGMSAMKRKDLRQKKMLLTLTSFALISQVVELHIKYAAFFRSLIFFPNQILIYYYLYKALDHILF